MLYLVGGCSRSGKSSLAERMRARHGIPWFPLDALKMGLFLGARDLGVDPSEEDLATADKMWPIVRGLIDNLIFDGRDYLLEGVNLRPASVSALIADADTEVRACFLGYPTLTAAKKATLVARHAGLPNDWLNRMGPDFIEEYLGTCVVLSTRLRDECAELGLGFFDTGADFEAGLRAAERCLISG